jgi:hypothetical protein
MSDAARAKDKEVHRKRDMERDPADIRLIR